MAPSASPGQKLPPGMRFTYQLAAAVRSINWTYAIFWCTSTSVCPAGVLTWKDGFYNGQIKTRKITNERVLQRSVQLRELYLSLLSGDSNHQVRRPAASLSPEDLTDDEWYYTLSMTYNFQPGQGLPGKCLASNQHVWLCNAQHADTKTFQRALLAKTTSLQTVVCIPFMGGVLELGVSNPVQEDPDMVNRIGTSFWQLHLEAFLVEELSSRASTTNKTRDTNVMLEDLEQYAIDGVASEPGQVEHVTKEMDEFHSYDKTLDAGAHNDNWIVSGSFEVPSSLDTTQLADALSMDDVFVTVSSSFQNYHKSSFAAWRRSSEFEEEVVRVDRESQNLLKKVVADGKWMNNSGGDTTIRSRQSNMKAHVMSERRQGEKTSEMFLVLKSLPPSIHNVDKSSILAETIAYLKELKERVEELESRQAPLCPKETTELWDHDVSSEKKIKVSDESKRKASEVERQHNVSSSSIKVVVMEKEVLLEVQCRWKDLIITQVFDEIKGLRLDVVLVHASTCGDLLDLKIRSNQQFACDSTIMAPGMITKVMQKAMGKR